MTVERLARPRLAVTGTLGRILLAVVAILLASGMVYYYHGVVIPIRQRQFPLAGALLRGNGSDLYPRWLGARELLWHGRNPYSAEMSREIQRGFYGRPLDPSNRYDPTDPEAFAYPIYVVFLLAPSLPFSFSTVQIVFVIVLLLLTAASLPLWLRALKLFLSPQAALLAWVATMSSFAVVDGLHLEQITLLVAALIAGSMAALASGRLALSGVLLALSTVKPQLAALVAAFLLCWTLSAWRSRKFFAIGFGATMSALLAGSELVLPGWFGFWRQALHEYVGAHKPSLLASLLGQPTANVVAAIAVVLCTALFWRFRKEPPGSEQFNFAWLSASVLTALLLPNVGSAYYNQVLLLPAALWLVIPGSRLARKNVLTRLTWAAAVGLLALEWVLALPPALATLVLHRTFDRETIAVVVGPQLASFFFPLALALFVVSAAPHVSRQDELSAS